MKYIGFDLGDGESCLSVYDTEQTTTMPLEYSITGTTAFPTVVGVDQEGVTHIGNLVQTHMSEIRVCFKRDFRTQTEDVKQSYQRFIEGVMTHLGNNYPALLQDDYQFVVGQPADWDETLLTQFVDILKNGGIHDPLLTSEPRAALVYFKKSNELGIAPRLLKGSVLIVDFGSSTLDFAYIKDGDTDRATIFGDPRLGGGLMDEQIVMESIKRLKDDQERGIMRNLMRNDPNRRSQLMIEARKLKEMFFVHEGKGSAGDVRKSCPIFAKGMMSFSLQLNAEILHAVVTKPQPLLGGNSLYSQLQDQLNHAKRHTQQVPPKLIILTGGASQMGFFRQLCRDTLKRADTILCYSRTPSYDIARGLALAGQSEANMKALKAEVQAYVEGEAVEALVQNRLPDLVTKLSAVLIAMAMPDVVIPTLKRWQNEAVLTSLETLNQSITKNMQVYLRTEHAKTLMKSVIKTWSDEVFLLVQQDIDNLCMTYNINPNLLKLSDVHIQMADPKTGEVIQISNVVDGVAATVLAVIMAVLCGGAGTALIATGPIGALAGIVLGLFMGKFGATVARVQIMKAVPPKTMRKLLSIKHLASQDRIHKMEETLANSLLNDQKFQSSLIDSVSTSIDDAIHRIATQHRL